ncbi:hypothetical protein JCM5353_002837 [Sporobolomyces roseus]
MNPNDFYLRQQPVASTSNPSSSQPQLDQSTSLNHRSTDTPKTQKELQQEKKDAELAELLEQMDQYKPVIPDEVTDYYLQRSGFDTNDVRVKRLLALAAQKFVSSISQDAFQYARARTAAAPGGKNNQSTTQGGSSTANGGAKGRQRTVLTMDDLSAALKEYGVDAGRAAYYL